MSDLQISRRRLHEDIAGVLRQEIARSRPGDRLDSEAKLAQRFSVSGVTIREALLALTKEGLIQRRQGSGTYVKDRVDDRHVAVLIELDISDPRISYVYLRVPQQLRRVLERSGYRVKLYVGQVPPTERPSEPTYPDFIEDVLQEKIRGVVAIATQPHPKWVEPLRRQGAPVVGPPPGYSHAVNVDMEKLVRLAVERLIEAGRRKLAWMGWSPSWYPSTTLPVFKQSLQEHGVPFHEEWISVGLHPSAAGAGWEEFREIWTARAEKPDGLIVADDVLFRDASTAILDAGVRVPEQLMVITHANKGSGILCPFPVARMEIDPDEYAEAMGQMLIGLMKGELTGSQEVMVPARWVEMPSVAPVES
jgi:GntR family transcriptional regulator of arabinose operon